MANEPALVSLRLNIVSGSILYLQMRFQSIAFCSPFHTSEKPLAIMTANPLKERLFLKLNPASIPRRDPVTRQQEINPDTQVARYGNQKMRAQWLCPHSSYSKDRFAGWRIQFPTCAKRKSKKRLATSSRLDSRSPRTRCARRCCRQDRFFHRPRLHESRALCRQI